jgi:superfamily II DNA or RNA helicase
MQALCPACNLKKGKTMEINLDKARPGQANAISTIVERITTDKTHTSIVLPTRYGKSDVIRLSALQLFANKIVSGSIVLSPGGDLRNQIVRASKVRDMCDRYGIPVGIAKNVHEWRHAENDPFANGRYLISTTIQYANRNVDDISGLINSRFYMTGLPVVVFVDETHMVSNKNKWGRSIQRFLMDANGNDNGARVVLLTATADRADGAEIPGFEYEFVDQERWVKTIRTPLGEHVQVDLYEGVKKRVKIKAHCEVTFKDAWNETPSPLCTLSRDCIDVEAREIVDSIAASDSRKLSELSPSQARLVIGKAVRDENIMRKGVAMFVSELKRAKELLPELAGIVFTGHDEDSDSEANDHANKVRRLVEDMSDFECVIATSKSEDDTVSNHLSKFEKGFGDVLIVKNAGGAGFDCSRLKVLLDLSSVRTFSSTVQRLMRVATPHGSVINAVVITLADTILSAIWDRVVSESGGEWVDGEMALIDSTIVPKEESPPNPKRTWSIVGGGVSAYDDTEGNLGDMEMWEKVEAFLNAVPQAITVCTKPMIAKALKSTASGSVEIFPDDEMKDTKDSIVSCAGKVARSRMVGTEYSQERYRETIKAIYKEMFDFANVDYCELVCISDIQTLKKLKSAISHIADESNVVWH